jgi:hypothetical protein
MAALLTAAVLTSACDRRKAEPVEHEAPPAATERKSPRPPAISDALVRYSEAREACADRSAYRKALFGDLHVHTAYSFDAYFYGVRTYPEDAYRFAKGEEIPFPPPDEEGRMTRTIRIDRPLDFVAVTDHAEFLGDWQLCAAAQSPSYETPFCQAFRDGSETMRYVRVIGDLSPRGIPEICGEDGSACASAALIPWRRIIEAAEQADDKTSACTFTALVGYEYTGTPYSSNYHRNVIFRNAKVPERPVSYIDAQTDIGLWSRLAATCRAGEGCEFLTIPHNSNLSNGRLLTPYADLPDAIESRRDYAQSRLRSEPLMEVFQHKGGSECINGLAGVLGEPDELCEFEQVRRWGETREVPSLEDEAAIRNVVAVTEDCHEGAGSFGMLGVGCVSRNDFYRSALLTGLREQQTLGLNPVKLGAIGSTDTHSSIPGAVSERDWRGHLANEWRLEDRMKPGILPTGINGNPGGLAGVWAVENSRDAIFDALRRREVFGTSGPRIAPRFFGGWSYPDDICAAPDMIERAYAGGVPMGGDLSRQERSTAPIFIASANRDPAPGATPLQKLQIIKGWVDADGVMRYEVHNVAGSIDPDAGVDLETASPYGEGHGSLCAAFRDPDFNPAEPAYYYLRVVENPSPRWSLHACLAFPEAERPPACSDPGVPMVVQELAWTSPIWYVP